MALATNDMEYYTVGWINWNSDSGLPVYSKQHWMKSDANKTLCGQPITREMDTDDGSIRHGECKKCRNAARKLGLA